MTKTMSAVRRKTVKSDLSAESIHIGKDLLELLSTAQYVDSMAVFREYVQNSADAIEEARINESIPATKLGKINVHLDSEHRIIRIRDTGPGIAARHFASRLTAFGASRKRGTEARGFRGVGRLVGLGYCQELVFRSRGSDDVEVLEMRWDCKRIKNTLRDTTDRSSLAEIVRDCVQINSLESDDWPPHFFEVELRNVLRVKNDNLLDASRVNDYLAQTAPVPFSPAFSYGAEISSRLKKHLSLAELEIWVNDASEPVYRPHRNDFQARGSEFDQFSGIDFHIIPSSDGDHGAIGWVLHHGYKGAIPVPSLRGLRLRSGNMQVGNSDLLDELFAETRFNSWSVGEIHTIDKRLMPNGRRDNYEQSIHFGNLTNQIAIIAKDICARSRQSSIRRNIANNFSRNSSLVRAKIDAIRTGVLRVKDRRMFLVEIADLLTRMRQIVLKNVLTDDIRREFSDAIISLQAEADELQTFTEIAKPLLKLPERKRRIYQEVFGLIHECSPSQLNADSLIESILNKLN